MSPHDGIAIRIDREERRRRLAVRHRLVPDLRGDDVEAITDDLVALHSSDPASVFLSATCRLRSPSIDAVERSLYETRTIVRHHAMRRTLWVMTPRTARLAHASSTRRIAAAERKQNAKFLGGGEDWLAAGIGRIVELLGREGPLTAREVGRRLPDLAEKITLAQGTSWETTVSAHTRLLLQAGFEATLVRTRPEGSWIGTQYAWSPTTTWLEAPIDVGDDSRAATADLAGRWLERFGPATEEDLTWWTGWTKTAVRRALADVEAVSVHVDTGHGDTGDGEVLGWALPDDTAPTPDPGRWVALLPGLDPTAMGWKQRRWYLDDDVAELVTDRSGNIGPTVWADGRIVGGWVQRPDGEIAIALYRDLDAGQRRLLDVEVERLVDTVGDTRFRVRFPAPNQKELLA